MRRWLVPPTRWPLTLQILALLLVSLLAVQLVTLVVVLVSPPPRAPMYRTAEIAAAIAGSGSQPQFGLPLVRTVEPGPPGEGGELRQAARQRRELAMALHVPEDRIRFAERRPSLLRTLVTRPEMLGRPWRRGQGELGPSRPDEAGRGFFRLRGEPPVFGSFVAAMQQNSGLWLVVRPAPEPFPSDWQRRVLYWFLGVFFVIAPVGYLFARRITAPLGAFARGAERLGRDPRAEPLALKGPAELGAAANAFNEMQVRLQRYVEDRTAMIGAISHDLRTPLARIRFKIERAEPELRDAIAHDLEQMDKMIAAALSFTRDASQNRAREAVDLLSLLECVVDDAALVGAQVALDEAEPLTIEADSVALQRLFANLVDNAVKYGGSARVSLERTGTDAVVGVADRGPGLAQRDLERVFQPFYRGEPARTLDKGGIGLGLAVARSIARAHGGDVTLNSTSHGLTAQVRLPLPAQSGA